MIFIELALLTSISQSLARAGVQIWELQCDWKRLEPQATALGL
jgi:hypothetical protein